MFKVRAIVTWAALGIIFVTPIAVAAISPLHAWRGPVYIGACFAGIIALSLILVQPLLAGGVMPGLPIWQGRRLHRWVGCGLVAAVVAHVAGLWLTSPPDVIDALLFRSPTPFSAWGVVAMWAVFAAALLATLRWPLRMQPKIWRLGHSALALVIVFGSVVHSMLIVGTMGMVSKAALCILVLAATIKVMVDLRAWTLLKRTRE